MFQNITYKKQEEEYNVDVTTLICSLIHRGFLPVISMVNSNVILEKDLLEILLMEATLFVNRRVVDCITGKLTVTQI